MGFACTLMSIIVLCVRVICVGQVWIAERRVVGTIKRHFAEKAAAVKIDLLEKVPMFGVITDAHKQLLAGALEQVRLQPSTQRIAAAMGLQNADKRTCWRQHSFAQQFAARILATSLLQPAITGGGQHIHGSAGLVLCRARNVLHGCIAVCCRSTTLPGSLCVAQPSTSGHVHCRSAAL